MTVQASNAHKGSPQMQNVEERGIHAGYIHTLPAIIVRSQHDKGRYGYNSTGRRSVGTLRSRPFGVQSSMVQPHKTWPSGQSSQFGPSKGSSPAARFLCSREPFVPNCVRYFAPVSGQPFMKMLVSPSPDVRNSL